MSVNSAVFDCSTPVSVLAGNNAWGAMTALYTSKMAWHGFKILSQSQNAGYTCTIQMYAGTTPIGPLLVSDGAPDKSWEYYMPGDYPAGTSFSAEVWYNTTTTDYCNFTLIGLVDQEMEDVTNLVSLGVVPGSANISCPATSWTSLGAMPPALIKNIKISIQNNAGRTAGYTYNFGIGPSSASITTVASYIPWSNAGNEYGWVHRVFKVNLSGIGNDLWIYNNSGQAFGANAYLYF